MTFPTWPWLKQDGKECAHLLDDNSCAIYAARPVVCRIEEGFPYFGYTSKRAYYRDTAAECNRQQEEDGMGHTFRVRIDE